MSNSSVIRWNVRKGIRQPSADSVETEIKSAESFVLQQRLRMQGKKGGEGGGGSEELPIFATGPLSVDFFFFLRFLDLHICFGLLLAKQKVLPNRGENWL